MRVGLSSADVSVRWYGKPPGPELRDQVKALLDEGIPPAVAHGQIGNGERWDAFVAVGPPRGLGATPDLVERVVGTRDPDLLRMMRDAERVGRGAHGRGRPIEQGESPSTIADDQTGKTADRLARDHPDEYDAVKSGVKTINAAAVDAGIRPRRCSVRTDDPDSAARSLRKNLAPDVLARVVALLVE